MINQSCTTTTTIFLGDLWSEVNLIAVSMAVLV